MFECLVQSLRAFRRTIPRFSIGASLGQVPLLGKLPRARDRNFWPGHDGTSCQPCKKFGSLGSYRGARTPCKVDKKFGSLT